MRKQKSARERNRGLFDGPFGGLYSFYIGRPLLSPLIARVVWGSDIRPYMESLRTVGSTREGDVVVDAPCGSGIALRHLRPEASLRYLAVDISRAMVERTRRSAVAAGLCHVEVVEGDATNIPLDAGAADLFLSHFGLHCFDDPRAALAEAARCLRPGGRLVGSAIVPAPTLRSRLIVRPHRGGFGRLASADEIRSWLGETGFESAAVEQRGLFAYFSARRGLT